MRSNARRFSVAAAPDDDCGPAHAFLPPAAVQKFIPFSFAGAKEIAPALNAHSSL